MIIDISINHLTSLNEMASNFNLNITEKDLNKEYEFYIGYLIGDKLVGFLNYSIYYERAEINYIFVLDDYRKKSIATQLLKYMFNTVESIENITLEVRESNLGAIELYQKNGFEKCAVRKKYYGNEDAIMMIKKCGDGNGR